MVNEERVLSMLGLAERAGSIQSGGFLTEEAIRSRRAALVIVACDAQKNTLKMIQDKCAYYHVPLVQFATGRALGHCIGKEQRACLAVTDAGFARRIQELLEFTGALEQ
jgi:ribosomal protein L7Ae-like RNA K-turn-binding protein